MNFTTIRDNSTVSLQILKQFLHIDEQDDSQDLLLSFALDAAKQAADDYCQNRFPETNGEVPGTVEMWILLQVGNWVERRAHMVKNITMKDVGMLEFKFDYHEYFQLLKPHRREVGFA